MPTLDATAKAAVESQAFAPAYYLWLDIDGDPLRVTTFGAETILSGTGDDELNGTYAAFSGALLAIGDVSNSESGSDSLTISLSGILDPDEDMLNDIGNTAKWQGRPCRVWFQVYDESGVTPQGAIVPLYTGYMSSVGLQSEPEQQLIQLNVENWLAAFNQPSHRSYMNQKDYDPADDSAAATLAASNGVRRETGGASASPPAVGSNPSVTPGFGYTGSGGYVAYTPYPDNTSVQYDNPSYLGTQLA